MNKAVDGKADELLAGSKDGSIYDALLDEVENGRAKDAQEELDRLMTAGKDKGSIKSKITESVKEEYLAGSDGDREKLEKKLLAQNAQHKDWACTEEMMKLTRDGKALYLHCLPADITGLSCAEGEVDNSVFDRYIVPLYKQASYKPYIIAAMIFMSQVKDPVRALMAMDEGKEQRKSF